MISVKTLPRRSCPNPILLIYERLKEARAIELALGQGASYEEVAQVRGVTFSHLKRLKLPDERLKLTESGAPSVQTLNFRSALVEAQQHEQRLNLINALNQVECWEIALSNRVIQVEIAQEEAMTQARVC